jgi:hypothetical protein
MLVLHFGTTKGMKKFLKILKLNRFLNVFRMIGPTGRNILKEWILAESQTTFGTTDHAGKDA